MKLTLDEYMRIYNKAKEVSERSRRYERRDIVFNRVFNRLVTEAKGGMR